MMDETEVIVISSDPSDCAGNNSVVSSIFKLPCLQTASHADDTTKMKPNTDEASVVTISVSSETSSQHCTLRANSRDKPKKNPYKHSKVMLTSSQTKVITWLNENYASMLFHTEEPTYDNFLTTNESNGILVRRDYNKMANNVPVKADPVLRNQVSNAIETNEIICVNSVSTSNSPVASKLESYNAEGGNEPVESLSSHEMQKKLELYEYLKLMNKNPPPRKKLEMAKNRRSSRVKNLASKKPIAEKQDEQMCIPNNPDAKKGDAGSSSKDLSDQSSKGSKQLSKRSLSVASSFLKSSLDVPSAKRIASTHSRNGIRSERLKMNNIESLQVPEISSTSIASNNTLRPVLPIFTNKKIVTKKLQNTEETNHKLDGKPKLKENLSKQSNLGMGDLSSENANTSHSILVSNALRKGSAHTLLTKFQSRAETSEKRKNITQKSVHSKSNKLLKYETKTKKDTKSLSKIIKKRKHFCNPLKLNRLRSRHKIGPLQLQSILFKSKKRKIRKKKIEKTESAQRPVTLQNKPFVTSDLIQPGQTNGSNKTIVSILEPDALDGLTPQHLFELVESKKFLDSNADIHSHISELAHIGFTNTDIAISTNVFEQIIAVMDCIDHLLEKQLENYHFTNEDLEVSRLMLPNKLIYTSPFGGTPGETHSPLDKNVGCSTSYPESSGSPLNILNCEASDNPNCVSTTEVPRGSTGLYEFLTSSTSHVDDDRLEVISVSQIEPNQCECQEIRMDLESIPKTLNDCLTKPVIKHRDLCNRQNWPDKKSLSHTVTILPRNGEILESYYLDFNLIVIQRFVVSFWNQTPLGNVLGCQDMWIPKGSTERLILENGCVRKESSEVIISVLDSVAYIELWTKEHKSEKRERPVADVFVAIYLTSSRRGCSKKVLQLENIHGFANDVQYIVLRNSRNIIVSWNTLNEEVSLTLVHCYELSPDYQTVQSIREVQSVSHYLSSLHNVEDCDSIVMGCGDQKITLWNFENIECCYIIATIDLLDIPPLRTLWAKCDRGFLFTLHEVSNGLLQLIAINSNDSTWKRLRSYNKPEMEYERLMGVCIENGILVACYDTGISCWNAQTSELILEGQYNNHLFLTFNSHLVIVLKDQVHVRQLLEYIISMEDT